ncbi:MAG: hypothetical protein ABIJ09_25885 [Pseudomonadota bacterium]
MKRSCIQALLVSLALGATPFATQGASATETANTTAAPSVDGQPRYGEPVPLSWREPVLDRFTLELDAHLGLVGSGPTQLTNDLRFGLFDWWELRTSFAPYPAGLMSTFKLGSTASPWGAVALGLGLAYADVGLRIFPEEDELPVGLRFHTECSLSYSRRIGPTVALFAAARWRHRLSTLTHDDQGVIGLNTDVTWDVMKNFSLTAGVGVGGLFYGEMRENTINVVEAGRPGLSHFLIRLDGIQTGLTLPVSMTYSLVDSFDVDVFATPRLAPQLDVLLGAGIRLRVLDVTSVF